MPQVKREKNIASFCQVKLCPSRAVEPFLIWQQNKSFKLSNKYYLGICVLYPPIILLHHSHFFSCFLHISNFCQVLKVRWNLWQKIIYSKLRKRKRYYEQQALSNTWPTQKIVDGRRSWRVGTWETQVSLVLMFYHCEFFCNIQSHFQHLLSLFLFFEFSLSLLQASI